MDRSDPEQARYIALGQRNAEVIEFFQRFCGNIRIEVSGGTGMLETATGLPIACRSAGASARGWIRPGVRDRGWPPRWRAEPVPPVPGGLRHPEPGNTGRTNRGPGDTVVRAMRAAASAWQRPARVTSISGVSVSAQRGPGPSPGNTVPPDRHGRRDCNRTTRAGDEPRQHGHFRLAGRAHIGRATRAGAGPWQRPPAEHPSTGPPVTRNEGRAEPRTRPCHTGAGLRGRSLFFTWLYRIAINEANRSLEKSSRRPMSVSIDAEALRVPADAQDEPSRRLEQTQLRQALSKALAELPPDYRTAIVLRHVEGLSTQHRPQRSSASARPRSRAARTRRG